MRTYAAYVPLADPGEGTGGPAPLFLDPPPLPRPPIWRSGSATVYVNKKIWKKQYSRLLSREILWEPNIQAKKVYFMQ